MDGLTFNYDSNDSRPPIKASSIMSMVLETQPDRFLQDLTDFRRIPPGMGTTERKDVPWVLHARNSDGRIAADGAFVMTTTQVNTFPRGVYDASTGVFTPPATGLYRITAGAHWDALGNSGANDNVDLYLELEHTGSLTEPFHQAGRWCYARFQTSSEDRAAPVTSMPVKLIQGQSVRFVVKGGELDDSNALNFMVIEHLGDWY